MARRLLAITLALAALAAAGPALGAQTAPPPPDRRALDPEGLPYLGPLPGGAPPEPAGARIPWSQLVFQSLRDDNWEVYRSADDGSGLVRLTLDPKSDVHPRLDRGAARVVFSSTRSGDYDVYTMNADGSGVARLTYGTSADGLPAWSPDGTRIAFESDRDGQAEVYVMQADGSAQTRLTYDTASDGEPAWSPDGSRIAFVSDRSGDVAVWAMDADGSDPQRLSGQPFALHPAWSPDGTRIAYSADGNNDGWLELWVMDADGSDAHLAYDPPDASTDAWAGSWSPDGRFVAFTRISFIYYQGNWYWIAATLDAWEAATGSVTRLVDGGLEWRPDWQSADALPPSSSVAPLPAQSPGPVPVSWSGSDQGPAGIASYDVQVQDAAGGGWVDWLAGTQSTSGLYPGSGGHTYRFRSRARDRAGNLEAWPAGPDAQTTVEALPPVTAVAPLPALSRSPAPVSWGGSDPGGSGIVAYDVQVQDAAGGGWLDWQVGVASTSDTYEGTPGHTYRFRSRGRDGAGNLEAWPPGSGDASTLLYASRLSGRIVDNAGAPVAGAAVTAVPAALAAPPSDGDGAYAAYLGAPGAAYTAAWSKAGYGSLPPTEFDMAADAQLDAVLPPAGDTVVNGGFESGSLAPGWSVAGSPAPSVTASARHTGAFAALLGTRRQSWSLPLNLSNLPGTLDYAVAPSLALGGGAIGVAWHDRAGEWGIDVFAAARAADGTWSPPVNLSDNEGASFNPRAAFDAAGTLHVAWQDNTAGNEEILYRSRAADGTWSAVVNVSANAGASYLWSNAPLVVDAGGAVHLVWTDWTGNDLGDIRYARRDPAGSWSAPLNVSNTPGGSTAPNLAAGADGAVHVVWVDGAPGEYTDVLYARRSPAGVWSAPRNLSQSEAGAEGPQVAVDASGAAHVLWSEAYVGGQGIHYTRRSPAGTWSAPLRVSSAGTWSEPRLAVEPSGVVHAAWGGDAVAVQYARRDAGGTWSAVEEPGDSLGWGDPQVAADANGAAHVAWLEWVGGIRSLFYRWRSAEGTWSPRQDLSRTADTVGGPALALDAHGTAHAVWRQASPGVSDDVYYADPQPVPAAVDTGIRQALPVPAGGPGAVLSFMYRFEGLAGLGDAHLEVQGTSSLTATWELEPTAPGEWVHTWLDLGAAAGQPVTLTVSLRQPAGAPPVWATLDELSLGPAYPDVWVKVQTTQPSVLPGEPVVLALSYGNRGGVAAPGAWVKDPLPAGLEYVTADPPPAATEPELTWEVGDLPPGSGPFVITLIAQVAPDVPLGTTLVNTASAGSPAPELEMHNNQAQVELQVTRRLFLPLVGRVW